MRFAPSFLGIVAGTLFSLPHVVGATREARSRGNKVCGAEPSEVFKSLAAQIRESEIDNAFDKSVNAPITIETYFHVLATTQEEMDKITDQLLQSQMEVQNEAYAPFGISFNHLETTRTVDSSAANSRGYPSDATTSSLHKGGYDALNVYFVTSLGELDGGQVLGSAKFPSDAKPGSEEAKHDGVAVLSLTLPGNPPGDFDTGKTLVHEAGHWLGLFHTFEGGCWGGDHVDDTPAQGTDSGGTCDEKRDTCPGQQGYDPVHNYMDYSSDACQTEFTQGQSVRMHNMWKEFRAPK